MSKAASDTLEKVSQEFLADVSSELQQGRAEALAAIESTRKDAVQAVQKILETSSKQAESLKRQIVGAAELEARNAQLKSLEKAVTEVFDGAMTELRSGSTSGYEEAMTKLLEEGVDVIGPKAKVACSAKDKKAVSAAIRKVNRGDAKLTLDDEPIETLGGVVLTTSDGTVKFDNTFEARMERMRSSLRKEVAGLLTGS